MNNQLIIKSLTLVMVFCMPSLAVSQNINLHEDEKSQIYQSDPFADYMLTADNPCNNNRYLELRNKSQDEMSHQERTFLNQKTVKCQDYLTSIEDSKSNPEVEVSTDTDEPWRPFLYFGAGIVLVSVGVIVVV